MTEYRKTDARAWAREHLRGVANVLLPTFRSDLRGLNEAAIRHDVRTNIAYGFRGALLVAEAGTTPEEYRLFTEIAADEARGRLVLLHHSAFPTLQENVAAVREAGTAGADMVLLTYPPYFHPTSNTEILEYTAAVCSATDLGVMLFPVPLWDFERLHPMSLAPELLQRMVAEIPNVVAIKAEGGMPTLGGLMHARWLVGDRLVISGAIEGEVLPLLTEVEFQCMGTSNYEYAGGAVPRIFDLLKNREIDAGMDLFWRIHPARLMNLQVLSAAASSRSINRMVWKYQAWLVGYNGGPIRQPTMRIASSQMNGLRRALQASGIEPTADADADFFTGRHPA